MLKTTSRQPPTTAEGFVALPEVAPGDRPRILVVDAVMPDETRDSGSVRLCNLMRILTGMGWHVDFMPDNLRASTGEQASLGALGVDTLCRPRVRSIAAWLDRHGPALSAVMLCRHYVASQHYGLVRRCAPSARVLFDTVDLHYLRETRAATFGGPHSRKLAYQADRTRRQELALVDKCDVTLVVSQVEKELLRKESPEACVRIVSNIHRIHPPTSTFADRNDLLFVGGWGHPPNRDAISWLVHDIMPRIRREIPDCRLHLVGDLPDAARSPFEQIGVQIHGRIADLSGMLHDCRVALAPLRYGAGVKGKINTAMSHGLPVVATSVAVEGMFLNHGENVLVGDTPEAFAAQVARAYRDPVLWQALSSAGMENIRAHFSFEAARTCLEQALGPST